MKKISMIIILLITAAFIIGCSGGNNIDIENFESKEGVITVFKSAQCGCCVGYVAALRDAGYTVEVVESVDLSSVKNKFNIPMNLQSCHTAVVGDYFIEGHVPLEALQKLLEEKPDIDGIVLPRMPSGSLGMPGQKTGSFEILALTNGETSEFMIL